MSKPEVPYVKGWKFKAYAHTPPSPPQHPDRILCPPGLYKLNLKSYVKFSPVDRCILYPPYKGTTSDFSVDLIVESVIYGGEEAKSQVVVVKLIRNSQPSSSTGRKLTHQRRFVAKFYDPLYFEDDESEVGIPFLNVNRSYINEVATYKRSEDLQGVFIPKFFGAYQVTIPVDPEYLTIKTSGGRPRRIVQMVLIEHIRGKSMDKITNPIQLFSQEERKQALKTIMETDMKLFSRDIIHDDLHNRNVMITFSRATQQTDGSVRATRKFKVERVTLIDFGHMCFDFRKSRPIMEDGVNLFTPGMYISPLTRWHEIKNGGLRFYEWVDWEWQPWLETEYAKIDDETIPPAMREYLLPDLILRNCYEMGSWKPTSDMFWTQKWYGPFGSIKRSSPWHDDECTGKEKEGDGNNSEEYSHGDSDNNDDNDDCDDSDSGSDDYL